MARFTETLFFFVFTIIAAILSAPIPISPPSDIIITLPLKFTTWQSGTTQAVTWGIVDPNNMGGKSSDTVSVSIWQFGLDLEPQKVSDIGTKIPLGDLSAQYVVPTEPEFTNMGLKYNSFNYWVLVEGDQSNTGGGALRGESGVFQFAPVVITPEPTPSDLANEVTWSTSSVSPLEKAILPVIHPTEPTPSVSPPDVTISYPKETIFPGLAS